MSPAIGATARWAAYACIFLIVGAVAYRLWVLGGAPAGRTELAAWRRRSQRRAATVGLVAAVALTHVHLIRLWVQAFEFLGAEEPLDPGLVETIAFDITWGAGWRAQLGAAVLAIAAFALVGAGFRVGWAVGGVAAMLNAATLPLTGHAVEGGWASAPVGLQFGHVLGAAAWIGTLAVTLVAGVGTAWYVDAGQRGPLVAGLVHRFSPLALGSVGMLVACGGLTGWLYLGAIPELWTTSWGRTLALKVATFLLAAALGYVNWQRVRPRLDAGGAERTLLATAGSEVAVALLILALTAWLVATPMPAG